jgi:carboxyl-terminal processing protease
MLTTDPDHDLGPTAEPDAAAPPDPATRPADLPAAADAVAAPDRTPAPVAVPVPAETPSRSRVLTLSIAVALVAILAGSTLFVSGYSLGRQAAADPGTPGSEIAAFQPFWDTYHAIRDRYAGGEVDRATIISGAIRGMIASLNDPYSSYLTPDEYVKSLLSVNGQFEGIGAEIATEAPDGTKGCTPLGASCRLVVTRPLPGSPAEKAGILAGDVILATDGTSLDGLTFDAARDRIRGPRGTVVSLTLQRGTEPSFDLTVTRDVVQQQEVVSEVLADGTVGYVRLNDFSDRAADELTADLAAHVKAGRTKIILDLRGNLGGYVTAARKVASQFIGSGVIFWEQDAAGNQVPTNALGDGVATAPDLQIVCLIDGGSASASEIVAGALQDTKRATLVGQKSYGKGTVQEWQELTDQGGAFRLTIARWLTPNKRWIHGVGLTPDVAVTIPADLPAGADPDLDRALELLSGAAETPAWQDAA